MAYVPESDTPAGQTSPGTGLPAPQPNALMTRSMWMLAFLATVLLAACAAGTGWFMDGFYAGDGTTLEAKGRYGDLAILILVVPLGLGAFVLERRSRPWARAVMLGVVAHLGFMYGVLAFDYDENALFAVYSAMLGLCLLLGVTGLIDFARSVHRPPTTPAIRLGSVGLLLAVLAGYGFWANDVIVALVNDTTAESLSGTDLPANAARVLDMAIMLPLTAIGAARLWTHDGEGLAISAVMSTYLVLISSTVIVMEVGLANTTNLDLDTGKIAGFVFTISLSLTAAVITYRALRPTTAKVVGG